MSRSIVATFVALAAFLFVGLHASPLNDKEFDAETARAMLDLSQATFCPSENIATWSCDYCRLDVNHRVYLLYDQSSNTFGFVTSSEDKVVVAFRGSVRSVRNVVTDMNAIKTPYLEANSGARVHMGFYKAYRNLKAQMLEAVANAAEDIREQAKKQGKPWGSDEQGVQIWVTGHSLGAALATLAAPDLVDAFAEISNSNSTNGQRDNATRADVVVYTFGSPRVGNAAFVAYYQQKVKTTYRVVNDDDIVPHLPPTVLGFQHVPTEVWLQANTDKPKRICSDTNGEDSRCSNSYMFFSHRRHTVYLGVPVGADKCAD